MNIIELTKENISQYKGYVSADIAENIGRVYYNGMIVEENDAPVAGMIWEHRGALPDTKAENQIVWLTGGNSDASRFLFERYNEIARANEVYRTTFVLPAKDSKDEKTVLKEMGFKVRLTEGDLVTCDLSEVRKLDIVSKVKPGDSIKALRTASQRGFTNAIRRLAIGERTGTYRDLAFLPRSYFDNDVSCYFEEDGIINGLFLVHVKASGVLEVVLMTAVGRDYVKVLPQMICFAIKSAGEIYDDETQIVFNRHTDSTLALGEKLFPTGFGIPMFAGERSEQY